MAVNIGPKIGIEGEAQYRQQMQNIIQLNKTLRSELKAAESGFTKTDSAMKKASERAKILKDAVKEQKEHVKQCSEMVKQAAEKYGEADRRTQKWKQALADAKTELNRLNGELANNSALKVWGEEVEKAGEKIQQAGKGISTVGDAMTKYVSAPIIAAGTASVKLASDYETSMAKLSTIANENDVPIDKMSKQIKALSDETGIGAADLAEAAYQAISAGRSTVESVNFVASSSKLAKAGFTDITTSVDTLTTILNAYGLSADAVTSISDKLITTQNLGKTTVAQLGQSLGTVIPTAAAYGVNIDNVAAAYVAMTKNGVSTAESTTYLNSMISELGKSGTTASDILKEKTGKSLRECMESGMSFADVLGVIVEGAKESDTELGDMFGNVRAGRAAMSIAANGAKEFNSAMAGLNSSAGATEKAFKKVSGTSATKFTKALNRIRNSGIEAGESVITTFEPAITSAMDGITKATSAFNSLSDAQKVNVVKWGAVAAAAGPAVSAFGKIVTASGKVVTGVGKAAVKASELASAIEASGGVYAYLSTSTLGLGIAAGAVVAPLAALAAVMWDAGKKSRQTTEEQAAFAGKVSETADAAQRASEQVGAIGASIKSNADGISTAGASLEYYRSMLDSCYDAEGNLKDGMEQTANYALNELNNAMGSDYSAEFVSNAENAREALEEINAAIDGNISKLKEQAIQQAFQSDYTEALKGQADAHSALSKAQDAYTEAVEKAKDAQIELNGALSASDATTGKGIERQQKAKTAQENYNAAVEKAKTALEKASGAAAEADAQVQGLESTMRTVADGTPEKIDQAAEAYANIGTKAEEAGERARNAVKKTTAQNEADLEALRSSAKEKIDSINQTKIKPEVDTEAAQEQAEMGLDLMQGTFEGRQLQSNAGPVANAKASALDAWGVMSQTLAKNMQGNVDKVNGGRNAATTAKAEMVDITKAPMQGNVNLVSGGAQAASAAHAQMVPIIANPMRGNVGSVQNAASAAESAWSTMQSILGRPMQAVVNIAHNVTETVTRIFSDASGHADGGFVRTQQLSWLAEGNQPEVVIPLSEGKRSRALELYRQTGAILAQSYGDAMANIPAGSTTNMGGVTVNVYGAQGQSEERLADIVIDRITHVIGAK